MGRYRGASCKICRRSREKLFLKGERCFSAKCAIEKRNYPPGTRPLRPRKISEYGRRLREKQKLRFFYGISERQMRIYFKKATRKKGIPGHNLLSLFECRFDNFIFRANLARSRSEARQFVRHSHFLINGKKSNIPSMTIKQGDIIKIKENKIPVFKEIFDTMKERPKSSWLAFNNSDNSVKMEHLPQRQEIDVPVNEQLIVEYYSK